MQRRTTEAGPKAAGTAEPGHLSGGGSKCSPDVLGVRPTGFGDGDKRRPRQTNEQMKRNAHSRRDVKERGREIETVRIGETENSQQAPERQLLGLAACPA